MAFLRKTVQAASPFARRCFKSAASSSLRSSEPLPFGRLALGGFFAAAGLGIGAAAFNIEISEVNFTGLAPIGWGWPTIASCIQDGEPMHAFDARGSI